MKAVVTWLWADGSRALRDRQFAPEHVNSLQKMCARYLPEPHRFICVADKPDKLSTKVEFLKTPPAAAALARLRSPEGERFPSCYRRLWNFSDEAKILGDRLLCIDIDLVVLNDLAPLYDMLPNDFVGWRPYRDWGRKLRYGGGIYALTPGARTKVWTDFKGSVSIAEARAAGFRGSDQAWISYKLGPGEPYWGRDAGIYSVRDLGSSLDLPWDARVVQFNGKLKPWHYMGRKHGPGNWVGKHWR